MNKNNDNETKGVDITDSPTGEFPALGRNAASNVVELNGAARAASPDSEESAKAAFWLTHLETEVSRLHAKWHTIDAEFKNREARIAELHDQVAAREATISKLTADLLAERAALNAAEERLACKEGEVAALAEDRKMRDERIAALSTELADAAVAHKATREEVERAQAEAARLAEAVRQEQAAAAASVQRQSELLAEQQKLQAKLQDLEIYINGRHESWSDQKIKLAEYKDALIGMEKTVKARDAVIARHDEEKKQLAARILDLERQCSELAGRRKEREEAYVELQNKLAAHIEQTEQLKAEHASRTKEMEQAIKQRLDREHHIESLERGIQRRDSSIEALTAELEQSKGTIADLTNATSKLSSRVDELEKGVADRSQQVQVLREDLRMSHEQLQLAQQQLAERTLQLASTQEAAEQKGRQIERLTKELEALEQEASKLRADLASFELHAAELGRLRSEAVAEAENLKAELAAQQELVASLEAELKSKQATEELLERNVGRITNLGASLAALDRQMSSELDEEVLPADASMLLPPAGKSSIDLADFVATLAADERVEAAAADIANDGEHEQELLPIDLLLDDGPPPSQVVDIGERTQAECARKLVMTIDGEPFDYPIVKDLMTIGRGHGSDIRIQSHFVSRLHAKIKTTGIATIIEDTGSKNGILVNSERVKSRVLRHGDVVSIGGELNLRFVDLSH